MIIDKCVIFLSPFETVPSSTELGARSIYGIILYELQLIIHFPVLELTRESILRRHADAFTRRRRAHREPFAQAVILPKATNK